MYVEMNPASACYIVTHPLIEGRRSSRHHKTKNPMFAKKHCSNSSDIGRKTLMLTRITFLDIRHVTKHH